MPEEPQLPEYIEGRTVYHSQEFKALAKLLGIPIGVLTTTIVIRIPSCGHVQVSHGYYAGTSPCDDKQERYD